VRDAFGTEIEEDDVLLSASTSRGTVKIGAALLRDGMRPAMVTARTNRRVTRLSPLGSMVVVLRKADGSVPSVIREAFE